MATIAKCSCTDFKILNIAATIVVTYNNLKPWMRWSIVDECKQGKEVNEEQGPW